MTPAGTAAGLIAAAGAGGGLLGAGLLGVRRCVQARATAAAFRMPRGLSWTKTDNHVSNIATT